VKTVHTLYFLMVLVFSGLTGLYGQESNGEMKAEIDLISKHGYQTLLNALEMTNLDEILQHSGPFTVFAPSDAAFKQIDADEFATLLRPEHQNQLRSLLTYHIVAGKITASGILRALSRGKGSARFTTVQGEELLATLEGSDIILTDCSGNQARIVDADMDRDNLVFHQIDKVILPSPL
jgi:uncharacterized surface protein with fasciclin (FAS1) repeats